MDADRVTGLLEYKRDNQHGREVFALVWSAILSYYWIDSVLIAAMFALVVLVYCVAATLSMTFDRALNNEIKKELEITEWHLKT